MHSYFLTAASAFRLAVEGAFAVRRLTPGTAPAAAPGPAGLCRIPQKLHLRLNKCTCRYFIFLLKMSSAD